MEVVVHGTKGGYRILFKTPGAPSIGTDIRNNVSSEAAIGKSAYSIAFAANGCVFTKYLIIRDTLRNDATGFLAFSLFLLINEELQNKGAEVKSILDELSNYYVSNYVRNNSINKGETNIIQEDWSFINNILARKTEQGNNRNNIEIQAGTKEAAFVFYKDDSNLQEYFSKPFQEDYNGYKQIFLISEDLRNSSADLLNALRNSGVELTVDFKNEYFYLNNYDRSRGLTITANDRPRSDGKNNNSIRAKEKVKIKYIKDYFKPIEAEGRLSDPTSDIYKYLEIKGTQIIIKYDVLSNNLKPIEKNITFNIKDWNQNSVYGAKIICKIADDEKHVTNNQVTFKGEDLGKRWIVSANNGRYFSEHTQIDFEKDCPGDTCSINIILNKHTLSIIAHEGSKDGDIIEKVNINKTEFIGKEIEKTHSINVSCRGYESDIFEYNPAKDESLRHIVLKKKEKIIESPPQHSYFVSAGMHGTLIGGNSYTSEKKNGSDVRHVIIPNKGYKFTGFEEQVGTLVAQYEKKEPFYKSPKIIAGSIACAIVIVLGILAFFSLSGQDEPKQPPQSDTSQIEAYIVGNSLILDTLKSYKSILDLRQVEVLRSLDSAIQKRTFIDDLNFSELKNMEYSPAQQKFSTAIGKIDNSLYDTIKKRLGNVSSWDLDKIADSIREFSKPVKQVTENEGEDENEPKVKKEETPKKIAQPVMPEKQNDENTGPSHEKTSSAEDISKKLQSATVTRDELQSWNNKGMAQYKNSIDLYLKFWTSIESGGDKENSDQLLKKINGDKYLKKSALQSFLKSVCVNSESFRKYKETPGKATCKTISELSSKVK